MTRSSWKNGSVVLVLVLLIVGAISTVLTWMVEHEPSRSKALVGDSLVGGSRHISHPALSTVLLFVGIFPLTLLMAYFIMALFWFAVSR